MPLLTLLIGHLLLWWLLVAFLVGATTSMVPAGRQRVWITITVTGVTAVVIILLIRRVLYAVRTPPENSEGNDLKLR